MDSIYVHKKSLFTFLKHFAENISLNITQMLFHAVIDDFFYFKAITKTISMEKLIFTCESSVNFNKV